MMLKVLHRTPVGRKFALVLFLPLVTLAWLAISGIAERSQVVSEMGELQRMTLLSQYAGDLVHELQRERGMSAAFLGSGGQNFRAELPDQRRQTDRELGEFNAYITDLGVREETSELATRLSQASQALDELGNVRQRVDRQEIGGDQSSAYYTNINGLLIDIVSQLTFSVEQGEIVRQLNAYYHLLNIKELAGIERAVLTTAFSTDALAPVAYGNVLSLAGRSIAYTRSFDQLAAPSLKRDLNEVLESPLVQTLKGMRDVAIERGTAGSFGVDHQAWFEQQTAFIDRLNGVGQKASRQLLDTAQRLRGTAIKGLSLYLTASLAATLLALVLSFMIVRSITRPLKAALDDIQTRGGDLTKRLAVPGSDELSRLYQAFNDSTAKTEELVANIKQSAQSVELASQEIAKGNADLAQRTEEQSSSLVQTASSMEQITANVRQSADTAQQARHATQEMAEQAGGATEVAERARGAMEQIHAANQKVTAIVEAIDGIAFQTNILALNASVEAARAGEQGRGFAVVASEVRNLASRSAEEAKQIRQLIERNVESITQGSSLVNATGEALTTIAERAQHTAALVNEISAAASEQSAGIEQINQALAQLDEVTQHNAALVEEVATASGALDEQASEMGEMVGWFKVGEAGRVPELVHSGTFAVRHDQMH
ncbi:MULTISPECIES: methyl-accepting chemotaxis protein [unclassified Halomonas]|uniref:methyl-accepting chemotaxis protein n=1 Tax=unclassified Halomonas TaxID=2609666 RepID=UPI0020A13AFF|nr:MULTISPECIES: methyl-accepting chemotaxis protein [unclassified Halomonas]MCP1314514.1 nitrate- and nitrite sensing domain-containing protein [Halomonas sp. 707D7]MCP1325337.1 nitrate- and nitrite sensing domain-containing protein [Halomonas sp. 707D4]